MHLRLFFTLFLLMAITVLPACGSKREPVQISTTEAPVSTEEKPVYSSNNKINSTNKTTSKSSSGGTDGFSSGMSHFHSIPIKVKRGTSVDTLGYVNVPASVEPKIITNDSIHYYASGDGMAYHMYVVIGKFSNNDKARDLMTAYASSMFDINNKNYKNKTVSEITDTASIYGVKLDYTDKNGNENTRYYYARKLSGRVLTVTVAAFANKEDSSEEGTLKDEFVSLNDKK